MGQRVSAVDQQTVHELDSLSWIVKDKFGLQPAARLDGQHPFSSIIFGPLGLTAQLTGTMVETDIAGSEF
jgi:hypothetical protein